MPSTRFKCLHCRSKIVCVYDTFATLPFLISPNDQSLLYVLLEEKEGKKSLNANESRSDKTSKFE